MNDYKDHIKELHETLANSLADMMTIVINLTMTGEMAEYSQQFGQGEIVHFEMAMFENITDPAVQKVIALMKQSEELVIWLETVHPYLTNNE
jgi:hypothetical protein